MTRPAAHKVMLLGGIGVGKSSLAKRLLFGRFSADYKPTIGVDVYRYDLPAETAGTAMSLILWDTDGNFGDAIFRHVYIKEAAAAVVIGDSQRPDTHDTMVQLAAGFAEAFPGRAIHYVLNKSDLVDDRTRPSLPTGLDVWPLFHTSALLNQNVPDPFIATARAIRRRSC